MKKFFPDKEINENSVIRDFRITAADGHGHKGKPCKKMQEYWKDDIEKRATFKKCLIVQAVGNSHAWRIKKEM